MEDRSTFSISIGEILYYGMFGILLFSKAIGWYDGMTEFKAVLVISAALFACKLLVTRQTRRDWTFIVFVCLFSAASYYCSGDKSLILYGFMMLGMKDVPVRRVMKWAAAVWTVGFVGMTALSAFGIVGEKVLVHEKHGLGYVICHMLGYSHPNVLHVSYVIFAALILYLVDETKNRRLLWIVSLLMLIGNAIVFVNSCSFTGLLMVMFLLALNLYLQMRGTLSGVENILLQAILPVCVVFSLVGPIVTWGTRLFDIINKILNTRYRLTYYFLTEERFTLMGYRMDLPNYRYTMDCSYTFLLMQLGIIPFVLILIAIFLLIRDALREKRYAEAAMIISFCVGGVSEPFLFNTSFKNMTFVFLGVYAYRMLARKPAEERSVLSIRMSTALSNALGNVVRNVTDMVRRLAGALETHAAQALSCFVVGMVVLAAALFAVNPWATSIYVPDDWHDDQTLTQVTLSEEDAQEILANHGEIIGDVSYYGEMVQVNADTMRVENARKSVNAGALLGAVIAGGYLVICTNRRR